MRSVRKSLQDHDLGHLRVLARLWELEPPTQESQALAEWLAERLPKPEHLHPLLASLPAEAREAIQHLVNEGGRLPWVDFIQRHGELREMGPGRRDREQPWLDPISPVEVLWYRGLIGRAFQDTPVGPKEFAYVPDELLSALPSGPTAQADELGRPAPEPEVRLHLEHHLVDDAVTLLAALRRRPEPGFKLTPERRRALEPFFTLPDALPMLRIILIELELLSTEPLQPEPQQVGDFLELRRDQALAELTLAWRESSAWNDFELLGHLGPGPGGWPNNPQASRSAALEYLARVPRDRWWDLDGFLVEIRERYPSFQRPGGDFDSWYLRDRRTGSFLRGLSSWDAVDGALLRAMILGPLRWFGAVDLGRLESHDHLGSFRLTETAGILLDDESPVAAEKSDIPGQLFPDGTIKFPRGSSSKLRYQIARLCSWLDIADDAYRYRLRPSSVLASAEQGLQLAHVRRLLEQVSDEPTPPGLRRALDRLAENRIEARADHDIVLQVEDAELLDRMVDEPKLRRWLGERLGPRAARVAPDDVEPLLRTAASLGLLVEPPTGEHGQQP